MIYRDKNGVEIEGGATLVDMDGNKYAVISNASGNLYIRGKKGFTKAAPFRLSALTLWGKADCFMVIKEEQK